MASLRVESPPALHSASSASSAAVASNLAGSLVDNLYTTIATTTFGNNHLFKNGFSYNSIGNSNSSIINMTFGDTNDGSNHFFMVPPALNVTDSNNTGNGSMGMDWTPPLYIMIWVTIAHVIVFLVGVVGNVLVIVVVLFVREMKTSTNLCLMNLSVADLLVILICQPSAMLEYYANEKWLLGETMCKMVAFLENVVTLVSILIIITVSLERFWAVYYPLKTYSTGSKSKAMVCMLIVWIIAAVASSPFLLMSKTTRLYHKLDNEMVDVCEAFIYKQWHKTYVISRFIFIFAIPLVLLIFLYSMIIVKVINRPMECKQMTETARAQAQQNRRQLVIMLIGIIVLFFLCLLPFRVFTLWLLFAPDSAYASITMETHLNIMNFTRMLIYVNSAGNPIIYHLASTKFRRAFQRVLRMYCPCFSKIGLGSGVHANGTYSHATRMTTMSHYSVVKQTANDYSESVDAV